ncbi:cyclin-dependent protein kinase inhibitor SMR12 [Eutrema salsugineum]|nr:cyclin-dependent protein kinase inhibitor SMR12 [Eutrema salsugineum]
MSEITSLKKEEVTLGDEVSETTKEDAFSDSKLVVEICRKRKRSDDEKEEEKEEDVEEENDGFKTPTRPENRIVVRECPPAPRRGQNECSVMHRAGKTMSCRRRLNFSPEDAASSFITDLQWRTTTMTIKK